MCFPLPRMNPPEDKVATQLRALIDKARETTPRLTLRQIADLCDVQYDRLWRFVRKESDTLSLGEAERLSIKLSGEPLFKL